MREWQFIGERSRFSGFVDIVTRSYELPGGRVVHWDIVVASPSVAILALTRDRRVVLARQFRPGPGQVLTELPGGGLSPGESPIAAAERELREETGYVGALRVIGSTWSGSGSTVRKSVAIALDCQPTARTEPDYGEDVEVVLKSLTDFRWPLPRPGVRGPG